MGGWSGFEGRDTIIWDGTIKAKMFMGEILAAPQYKDINAAGIILAKPSVSNPDLVNFKDNLGADTTIPTYAFGVDEYLSGGFEIQHDYKEGTDLIFHVHFQIIAAPADASDNVQWRLTYAIFRDGLTLTSAQTIDTLDKPVTTQYASYRSDFPAISGTSLKIGDQFIFNLYRVAADSDDFAGDCLIETAGIHYQVDTLGSNNIFSK